MDERFLYFLLQLSSKYCLKFRCKQVRLWISKQIKSSPASPGTWWSSRGAGLSHWTGSSPACLHAASPSPQTLAPESQTCSPGSRCRGGAGSARSSRQRMLLKWSSALSEPQTALHVWLHHHFDSLKFKSQRFNGCVCVHAEVKFQTVNFFRK